MLKKIISLIILSLFISIHGTYAFAKDKTFKVEAVKKGDLGTKPFKDYPEAKVRILFDFGNLLIAPSDSDFTTKFSRHLRLKYLGDTLLSPYLLNLDFFKTVDGAVIYSLENGKVKKTDISQSWNELNKFEPFSKTLKQLKKGDILEFKFSITIPSPHVIPGWQFEYEFPVNWSELRAEVPDIFVYRPVFKGYVPLLVNNGEIKTDKNGQWVEGDGYYIYRYRFAIENIPPFKKVEFLPSSRDYLTAVDFYLEKIQAYKGKNSIQGKTWGELTTAMSVAEKIGKRITDFDAQSILEAMNLPEDVSSKTGYIYYWLKNRMSWNGKLGIVADRPLNEVFESKSGSVAELNLLLVATLKKAGIDAYPLVLRTVELGNLNMSLPQISQFNYLAAYTRIIDADVLMDISEPCLEPGILRISCLNGKGLKINSRFEEWIDLEGINTSSKRITIQAEVKADSITGVVIEKRKNYFALEDCINFNKGLKIIKFDSTINILDVSYAKMDSIISGNTITIKLDASSLMQDNSQTFSIYPFWFENIDENPFLEKTRRYPIIFPYFFNYTWNLTFTLSEEYKLTDLPKGETIAMPDNSLRFIYSAKQLSNIIQISAQLTMLKRKFDPAVYDDLKTFYKDIIKKMQEPIKIKK